MSGIDPTWLIALGMLVVGGLFYSGKLGNFKFKKKDMELGMEAPSTPIAQPTSTSATNIQINLNEEGFKKELENFKTDIEARLEEQTQKLLESGNPDDQEEINTLQKELAGVQAKLDDTQKALEDRKTILAETEKALENEKLKNVVSKEQLTEAMQKLEEGDASVLEGLFSQYMEEKQSRDEPWAEVAYSLGKLAQDRIDYQTAQNYYEQAAKLAPDNTLYLNDAGVIAFTLGDYQQSIGYFEKVLASELKAFGPEHPKVAKSWNNIGAAWRNLGEFDKAINYLEKALESDLKTFGLEHPDVAIRWNNLGAAWIKKENYEQAIYYLEKALASDLKTFGSERPDVTKDWNNLGVAWGGKGDFDKAITYFEKALESDLKTLGPEHPDVARDYNSLGTAWGNKSDYDKAIGYFEKALKVVEKVGLPHRVQLIKDNIAEMKKQQGEQ